VGGAVDKRGADNHKRGDRFRNMIQAGVAFGVNLLAEIPELARSKILAFFRDHGDRLTSRSLTRGFSLGGFRTPAAEYAAPSRQRPASETLHRSKRDGRPHIGADE
jgi:hypothetical protein